MLAKGRNLTYARRPMFNLQEQSEAIHDGLVAEDMKIARDKVDAVLRMIGGRYPELDDADFRVIFSYIRDAIERNAKSAERDYFPSMVLIDLDEDGTLVKEPLPYEEEINIPETVIAKLNTLQKQEIMEKTTTYIILHSSTDGEVTSKLATVEWGVSTSQFLIPLFRALCKRDPSVQIRMEEGLSGLDIFKKLAHVPDFLHEYASCSKGNEPYNSLAIKYGEFTSPTEMRNLHKEHVRIMLREIRAFITAA